MNGWMAWRSANSIRRIPANRGIVNIDKAPRNARGNVEYRSDICILRPADPERGNGRILYEVNNRGRIMLFANLCAGKAGNQPQTAADLGNALPLAAAASLWCGPAGIRARRAPMADLDWTRRSPPITVHRSSGASARSSSPVRAAASCSSSGCPMRRPRATTLC